MRRCEGRKVCGPNLKSQSLPVTCGGGRGDYFVQNLVTLFFLANNLENVNIKITKPLDVIDDHASRDPISEFT